MKTGPKVYIDTNAFIYTIEERSERSSLLNDLFSASARATEPFMFTSELTLAEVLTKPYREHDDDLISRFDNLIRDSNWLRVQPIIRPTLYYAGVIRAQMKLKLPDAIHLSTAFGSECSCFLTSDRALRECTKIVHTRFGVSKSREISMISPDIPTLTTLVESLTS